MPKGKKPGNSAQVEKLRTALAREKAKSAALAKERAEAREQQAAAAEILKVINRSPDNAQPVFDAIVKRALRLMRGHSAGVTRLADGVLHLAGYTATSKSGDAALRRHFTGADWKQTANGRAIRTRVPYVIPDTEKAQLRAKEMGRRRGYRSMVVVPLLRNGAAIGALAVTRKSPGPFSKHEIGLLETFAEQAVIAIENVRRFDETKQALERQTATGEILRVISDSPADIQPVFDAIAKSAARFCGAVDVLIHTVDGEMLRRRAHFGPIRSVNESRPLAGGTPSEVAILERRTIRVDDMVQELKQGKYPGGRDLQKRTGFRSLLAVPLLRDRVAVGVISMRRLEVDPFAPRQIELAETFAAQAVIAIENVRLFNETKEALERQTATAEILKVISGSPTSVQPVFQAIVDSALQLLVCTGAGLLRREGDAFRVVAMSSADPALRMPENPRAIPIDPAANFPSRVFVSKAMLHIPDWSAIELPMHERGVYESLGVRSSLLLPMMREGDCIGVLFVSRSIARPYTDKEIALMQSFVDQAMIAVENVRLFNETREALERQTATAEILKVIASSPSDVQPVFDAIAASARRLLNGGAALVNLRVGDMLELAAYTSTGEAGDAALRKLFPTKITGKGHMGKAILAAAPVLISDIETEEGYSEAFKADARTRGFRSVVSVPMMKDGEPIGGISVNRPAAGNFTEHQTNLLKTFADQAVIAIENLRLFN